MLPKAYDVGLLFLCQDFFILTGVVKLFEDQIAKQNWLELRLPANL